MPTSTSPAFASRCRPQRLRSLAGRNIKHATLVQTEGLGGAFDNSSTTSSRPSLVFAGLLGDIKKFPGGTILDGKFTAVQQAVGTRKANTAGAKFLSDFVEEAKKSGLVAKLIERHSVVGLSVAPPA